VILLHGNKNSAFAAFSCARLEGGSTTLLFLHILNLYDWADVALSALRGRDVTGVSIWKSGMAGAEEKEEACHAAPLFLLTALHLCPYLPSAGISLLSPASCMSLP